MAIVMGFIPIQKFFNISSNDAYAKTEPVGISGCPRGFDFHSNILVAKDQTSINVE